MTLATLPLLVALAATEGTVTSFALLVGNNRSLQLARPDLHYADDDALKYQAVFLRQMPADHVKLLARPDQETAGLMPLQSAAARAPDHVELEHATVELAQLVQAAKGRNETTALFVVFAGHGDVERGQGYMELEDGPWTRDQLKEVLVRVGADAAHLILDSCNSFFVVHPRRPGGRVWATPADITQGLSVPGMDVGVFLSTDSEAQVYEWSQLQSGLFSHAVRSGLMGGADANGDQRITYQELYAFVVTANAGIVNSAYRPHVFFRSPKANSTLLDLRTVGGKRVRITQAHARHTLRSPLGVRWWDIRTEEGFEPWMVVDAEDDTWATEDEVDGRPVVQERGVETDAPLRPAPTSGRGASAVFDQYFSMPFGPDALLLVGLQEDRAPPPVFGLTREAEHRLVAQLGLMARAKRIQQLAAAAIFPLAALAPAPLVLGLVAGAAVLWAPGLPSAFRAFSDQELAVLAFPTLLGASAAFVGLGVLANSAAALPVLVAAAAAVGAWVLRDAGSTPGTAEGALEQRLRRAPGAPRERAAHLVDSLRAFEQDLNYRRMRTVLGVGLLGTLGAAAVLGCVVTMGVVLGLQSAGGTRAPTLAAQALVGVGALLAAVVLLAAAGASLLLPQQDLLLSRLVAEAAQPTPGDAP
jgi:hypothetical protein